MVDFNNETTVTTPPADIVKISILQRRYDLIEAYEDYKKRRFNNVNVPLSIVRARLISMFLEIQAALKRRLKSEAYELIKERCLGKEIKEEEVLDTIFKINEELDAMRLIVPDTAKAYNKLRVEEENKEKGF